MNSFPLNVAGTPVSSVWTAPHWNRLGVSLHLLSDLALDVDDEDGDCLVVKKGGRCSQPLSDEHGSFWSPVRWAFARPIDVASDTVRLSSPCVCQCGEHRSAPP